MLLPGGETSMTTAVKTLVSGDWRVRKGSEDEFVQRWTEFLEWTKANVPGFIGARLIRDADEASHFISFAEWEDPDARQNWRGLPEFATKMGACRALCDEMRGANYDLAAAV
jgi:heme-degrading monooxygenase HmoA